MRLIDLDPHFIRYETRIDTYQVVDGDYATWRERGCPWKQITGPREYTIEVPTLPEAQGVRFECPKCTAAGGQIHSCVVTFEGRGVAPEQGCHNKEGKPTRWNVSGNGLHDLTTTPSVLLEGGCCWHGFITNGEVTSC